MTRDTMKGMSLEELVQAINHQRRQAGLSAIAISTRPSSMPGKTTLEVHGGDVLLAKSVSGGAISFFLKGMFCATTNAPAPRISGGDLNKLGPGSRAISWRD